MLVAPKSYNARPALDYQKCSLFIPFNSLSGVHLSILGGNSCDYQKIYEDAKVLPAFCTLNISRIINSNNWCRPCATFEGYLQLTFSIL